MYIMHNFFYIMRLVLNVAEKPAMARQIAAALSGGAFDTVRIPT